MRRTSAHGLAAWVDGTRIDTGVHDHSSGSERMTSYATISRRGDLYARAFDEARPGKRATIALALPNGAEFLAALTGAIRAGADVYCLSSQDRAETRQQDSIRARLRVVPPDVVVTSDGPARDGLVAKLEGPLRASVVLANELDGTAESPTDRSEHFRLLQFTSGSTADIKGVRISATAFSRTIETIEDRLEIQDGDIAATWLPITHDMGLVGLVCQAAAGMNDLHVFQPLDFIRSPWSFLRAIAEHRVTITALPPFALGLLLSRLGSVPPGLDLSALRAVLIGGERVNADLLAAFEHTLKRFGLRAGALLPSYGAAEATVAISIPHLGVSAVPTTTDHGSTLVSCGHPVRGTVVRIVDETGEICPDGVVGEIVVEAPTLADGYLSADPASGLTRLTPLSSPYRTGDSGLVRDGQVFPVGRLGDAVKVRGSFLHAEDIEQTAMSELVSPVTVVLGDNGDRQMCLVLCKESLAAEATAAVSRAVSGVDAAIEVVPVNPRHMARTTSGKPRRSEIWRSWQAEARQVSVSRRGNDHE